MREEANTQYADPTGNPQLHAAYTRPGSANEERLIAQAIASIDYPGAALQELVRPPLPQIQQFPARTGYGPRKALGLVEVLGENRTYPQSSAFSGGPASYSGSSVNSLGGVG